LLVDHPGNRGQDRLEKPVLRVADLELGCMNADRDSAGSGVEIIPDKGALASFVVPPLSGMSQGIAG
jgi:hypothetical protein